MLVARVVAQDANDVLATDDFALVADLLDAGSNLHVVLESRFQALSFNDGL